MIATWEKATTAAKDFAAPHKNDSARKPETSAFRASIEDDHNNQQMD